jgi:hypothetical protein
MKALAVYFAFGAAVGLITVAANLAFWPSLVVFWVGIACAHVCRWVDK